LVVKGEALAHEGISLNILAAMGLVLFLVWAMAALAERMRLARLELGMVAEGVEAA
jgi:hypothetical protein